MCFCSGKMRCTAAEHPLVYAEPPFYSKDSREQVVERLFESFGSPAIFLAKNPVLASFALGRQTSLVVDIGYDATIGAARCAVAARLFPAESRRVRRCGGVCCRASRSAGWADCAAGGCGAACCVQCELSWGHAWNAGAGGVCHASVEQRPY